MVSQPRPRMANVRRSVAFDVVLEAKVVAVTGGADAKASGRSVHGNGE